MEFIEIQRNLVNTLLKIPEMEQAAGRTSLLDGLPSVGVERQNSARLDLNRMLSGLEKMGRLTKEGGVRPMMVVVDNALAYVPDGSAIADELHASKKQLEDYYGGDVQPAPGQPITNDTFEALLFGAQRDTRLPFAFIQQAQVTARSVARLTVPRIFNGVPDGDAVWGTGWLIAPGLLLTNHHVIEARAAGEQPAKMSDFEAQAKQVTARFDYHVEQSNGAYYECQNAKLLAANRQLDYAVLELDEAAKISDRTPLALVPTQPMLTRGARVNIVQYPRGGPLRYAIRNNFFVRPADKPAFLFYQTDTEPGASGSPVCNDNWQVIALHHAAQPVPPEQVPQDVIDGKLVTVTLLNEAIQMHSILADLPPDLRQRIGKAQGMA